MLGPKCLRWMVSNPVMHVLLTATMALAITTHVAVAGPYCSTEIGFAPSDRAELPVAPTIAYAVNDGYYGGLRYAGPQVPGFTATIDGKPVPMTTKDLRTASGVIRLYSIRSRATGKLELWRRWKYADETTVAATYTIVPSWKPGATGVRVEPGREDLGPYKWAGDFAGLRIELPAIAFAVRWREHARAAWREVTMPVFATGTYAEARVGEEVCGMHENIPMKKLAAGIELELRARLPDGRVVAVTEAPMPLVFAPANPTPKPPRATARPPSF